MCVCIVHYILPRVRIRIYVLTCALRHIIMLYFIYDGWKLHPRGCICIQLQVLIFLFLKLNLETQIALPKLELCWHTILCRWPVPLAGRTIFSRESHVRFVTCYAKAQALFFMPSSVIQLYWMCCGVWTKTINTMSKTAYCRWKME